MENSDKKQEKNKLAAHNPSKLPIDLIDDLKENKIDPLTEGATNLGYEERPPRKKELEQKEHYDQEDK